MSTTPTPPADGTPITRRAGQFVVPDNPIIPFIEGDGTGPDIWRASVRVMDAAVERAYRGKKKIAWMEVFAGEKSFKQSNSWLPDETVDAFREYLVGIKGPLTTPVGGGIRSLNVALRQLLDLFICLRPVRWYRGVPSPIRHPEKVDMVIFRENIEDIYAGIEYAAGSPEAQKMLDFLEKEFPKDFRKIRVGSESAGRTWQAQLEAIGAPPRRTPAQGRDCRHHAAAGADAARRIRRHRDAESERRLSLRCARRTGRRHRHRAGRQHQRCHGPRSLRGHTRDGAQVHQP